MNITVVIPTKGRPTELCDALRSIAQQTVPVAQVIVVDASPQAADPGALQQFLETAGSPIEFIYQWESKTTGLTVHRNVAIPLARGDVIQFLDDDAELAPDYFSRLLPVFADPAVGGAAGWIIDPAIGRRRLKRWFWRLFYWGAFRQRREELFLSQPRGLSPTNVLPGVSAYRRTVFDDLRFDEALPGAGVGEDIEFSFRVGRRWRLYIEPSARLFHHSSPVERQSLRRNIADKVAFYHYHFRKNMPGRPLEWAAYGWLNFGLLLDAAVRWRPEAWLGWYEGWHRILERGLIYRPAARGMSQKYRSR